MIKIVRFNTSALENLVRVGVGTYKKEDYGYLYGHYEEREDDSGIYFIESILPVPRRERFPTSVNISDEDKEKNSRMEVALSSQFIGDFHFHILHYNRKGWHDTHLGFSKTDIEDIKESPQILSLIAGIKKTTRITKPILQDKIIGGCVIANREKYNIKIIAGFYGTKLRRAIFDMTMEQLKDVFTIPKSCQYCTRNLIEVV